MAQNRRTHELRGKVMMVDKKGHKRRNIQEQVKKNKDDIKDLQERMPVADFVIHASVEEENGKHLKIRQRVDDEIEEITFKGGKDLIAGPNINITETDTSATISATTEPVGSVSFENIAGDAMDNTNLAGHFNKKQTKLTAGSNITITEYPNTAIISATFEPITDYVTLSTGQNITGFKTFVNDNGISIGGSATPINRRIFIKVGGVTFYSGSSEIFMSWSELFNKQDHDSLEEDVSALGFLKGSDRFINSLKVENHTLKWTYNDDVEGSTYIPYKTSDLTNDSDFTTQEYVDTNKQDKLVSGTNIKTINGASVLGAGNIQISGEPDAYLKSAAVSGNTLNITNKDGTIVSFTPSAESGITDVKVNGTSVVTEGVANISIPEDAQFVYDMTLNLSTGSVTINNPNYYSRIIAYHDENDKWPVIYGTVHITGQPDIIVLIRSIVDNGTSLTLTGTYDQYGTDINFDVIEVAVTSSTQIAVFTQKVLAQKSDIPTKTSELNNDSDFAYTSDIPTALSELSNDVGYITAAEIPDVAWDDVKGKPTNVSYFTNDAGYITGVTPSDIAEALEGSDFISLDENPETEKLQISFDFTNLDQFIEFPTTQSEIVLSWTSDSPAKLQATLNQTVRNKINNSLQLPTTHTEETLVGVDTTGAQEQVKIGTGLSVVNGALTNNIQSTQTLIFTMEDDTEVSVEVYVKAV